MRIATNDMSVMVKADGAEGRRQTDFGDATASTMDGTYFKMAAGTDITPLLQGLENDLCQTPHWGYLVTGEITVTYTDGAEEEVSAGDMFYWPAGHTLRVSEDAEIVLFSPQHQHAVVVDHIQSRLSA